MFTQSILGDYLIRDECYPEAEKQLRAAVAGYERTGMEGFGLARTWLGLARSIRLGGRLREALPWHQKVQA